MKDMDTEEAKRRAEWLNEHRAPKDWLIITESEISSARTEFSAIKCALDEAKKLRNGDNKLIQSLAEDAGIKINCDPKMLGVVWEQFHDGVMLLKRERDEWAERWAELSRATVKDVVRLERERDEAREKITKLRDIAEEMFFYVQHTVIQEKFRAELDKEGAK